MVSFAGLALALRAFEEQCVARRPTPVADTVADWVAAGWMSAFFISGHSERGLCGRSIAVCCAGLVGKRPVLTRAPALRRSVGSGRRKTASASTQLFLMAWPSRT